MPWPWKDKPGETRASAEAEAEAMRAFVEERAQFVESLARAIAEERVDAARDAFEARAQQASAEAKAYADQGLHVQNAALGALGRVVVELSRDNKRLARDRDALRERLETCEAAIRMLKGERSEPDAPDSGRIAGARLHFDASRAPLADFLHVDLHDCAGDDALARAKAPGLATGAATRIVATRVAELFPARVLAEVVFPRWRELLAEGGELALTCFVGEAPLADARDDGLAFAPVRSAFLASDDEGAPPRSVAPEEMKAMLERAALRGRRNHFARADGAGRLRIRGDGAQGRGMTMAPSFSIVICTDARLAYLKATLESLLFLRRDDFEVCVVCGPTADGTRSYVEGLSARCESCALARPAISRDRAQYRHRAGGRRYRRLSRR